MLFLAFAALVSVVAPDTSRVSLVDVTPINVTLPPTGRLDTSLTLLVRNAEQAERVARDTIFFADSSTGAQTAEISCCRAPIRFAPGFNVLRLHLVAEHLVAGHVFTGFVMVNVDSLGTRGASRLVRPIRIAVSANAPRAQGYITAIAAAVAALALVLGLIRTLVIHNKYDKVLRSKWSLSNSWASNFGVVGTLFTAILSIAPPSAVLAPLSRSDYASLSGLFGATILLAPAVFVLAKGVEPGKISSRIAFVVASAFTLAGAVGQLILLWLLVADMKHAGSLGAMASTFAWTIEVLLAIGLGYFAFTSLKRVTGPDSRLPATRVEMIGGRLVQTRLSTFQPLI